MNRLFVVAAATACAALFSGCEDPCETGLELKTRLATLEATVSGTALTPSALPQACVEFRGRSVRMLDRGSAFSAEVARRHFYWEERVCRKSRTERRCEQQHDPNFPPYGGTPVYICKDVVVCDRWEIVAHKRDGYDQAISLSHHLVNTRNDLIAACAYSDTGSTTDAVLNLVAAKARLRAAQSDAEYVLKRAGCSEGRKGD